jgi:hypothetical protein
MKRLFFAIALVAVSCLSTSAYATDSQNDSSSKPEAPERQGWREDIPLYGDVESVVVTTYKLEEKFGEVVRGDIESSEKYYFNKAGDMIEWAGYNSDGSLRGKDVYKYDTSGNMIEWALYDSDGSLDEKHTFKYDTSGNMIEWAWYNSGGSLDNKHTYKYDSSGNQIETAYYGSDGSLRYKIIYKYDASGNIIEETTYSGEALMPHFQTVYEITYRN